MRRAALTALYFLLASTATVASEIKLEGDGWYRWEVESGSHGHHACCHRVVDGKLLQTGCELGNGANVFNIHGQGTIDPKAVQVFAEVRNGKVYKIQALSGRCPVRADAPVRTIDGVTTLESITWLESHIHDRESVMEEAVMAISFHADSEAFTSLSGMVENRELAFPIREQALFWMVQSGSDETFVYLDRLLD